MSKKAAVVTGGGTGIGAATCIALAKQGFNVVVGYSRSKEGADKVVKQIITGGGEAISFQVAVEKEADVIALFQACQDTFGGVDVVVNNAGIGYRLPMVELTTEDYDQIFDVNARGTFHMCREAARKIEDGGRIVNVSTGGTRGIGAGMSLYTASKMAVEGFAMVLSQELGERGVTVNNVLPGMVDTPMLEGKATPRDKLAKMGAMASPLKRIAQPEEIADAIVMLCTEAGRFINGQNICVDGGAQPG